MIELPPVFYHDIAIPNINDIYLNTYDKEHKSANLDGHWGN